MADLDRAAIMRRLGAAISTWSDSADTADEALRVMQASASDVPVLLEALAAAEARGRREGQQWAIDALRDEAAMLRDAELNATGSIRDHIAAGADWLERLARSLDSEQTGGADD